MPHNMQRATLHLISRQSCSQVKYFTNEMNKKRSHIVHTNKSLVRGIVPCVFVFGVLCVDQ